MSSKDITIVEPNGYCSGVKRAISIALKAKEKHPQQCVYVLGMLVHNNKVTDFLNKKGIKILDNSKIDNESLINNLTKNDIVILSAHGHNEKIEAKLKQKGITYYDSTCPKVKQNLSLIKEQLKENGKVIYIGKKGHPECNAALSISPLISFYDIEKPYKYYFSTNDNVLVINQTTLNNNALKVIHSEIINHLPQAKINNEICASTRLRQEAVEKISQDTDLILIVGDKRSSNANKLLEVAKSSHAHTHCLLINDVSELDFSFLKDKKKIAIASGASTMPETISDIYQKILNYLW